MGTENKVVDGFRFMPPGLKAFIARTIPNAPFSGHIPWTPMKKPLQESTFSLMTSAGINMKGDPPFDMERETREPAWGDPTHREISRTATEADIDVNHWHVRNDYIKKDMNVMLPIKRFTEFGEEGIIGKLAPTCYSFYGFQLNPKVLLEETMPKVSSRMKEEGVEAVFLTPSWPLCCQSVGLVARFLEEAGFSTVMLTMIPEYHRAVGIPRVAAIEHPFGRPVGGVGDREGQRAVLLEALSVFEKARTPGEVFHLPFTWPEEPRKTKWMPDEPAPIIKMHLAEIKKAAKQM